MSDTLRPSPANMPAHQLQTTFLESTYGFQNPAFTAYMNSEQPWSKLNESWGANLAKDPHPIVQMAAGSVVMEAALSEQSLTSSGNPLEEFQVRKDLLAEAKGHWLRAAEAFPSLETREKSGRIDGQTRRIQVLALHSALSVPLMEISAAGYAQYTLPKEDLQARFEAARSNSALLASSLLNMQEPGRGISMCAKMACSAIGTLHSAPEYLIFPAPFRSNHYKNPNFRHHMLAIATAGHHRKIPIKVDTSRGDYSEEHRCVVTANQDLAIHETRGLHPTLQGFVDSVEGRATPRIKERLAAVNSALTKKLDAWDRARLLKQAGTTTQDTY